MTALNFTFVIARYGNDILGGVEKHARDIAERLAQRGHRVRVHTTCARSYTTWENELSPGVSELAGVEIVRHLTKYRRLRPWDEILKVGASVFVPSRTLAAAWAFAQGPVAPALLDAVCADASDADLVVFFSLLSLLTFQGVPRVKSRSALVPVVHEERPIYTVLARETLKQPRALFVNTEEEAHRIRRVAGASLPPIAVVAVGREEPAPPRESYVPPTHAPYVVILGRLAKTKPLLPVWRRLVQDPELPPLEIGGVQIPWRDVRLVTVGQRSRLYDDTPNVVALDFVSDEERWQILRSAVALINPSIYESLSLVLLEAWACARPVVVNDGCDVTVGQCTRSGGGIAIDFADTARGARQMAEGLASQAARLAMGSRGEAYVRARYNWERVLGVYERVATAVRRDGDVAEAAQAPSDTT